MSRKAKKPPELHFNFTENFARKLFLKLLSFDVESKIILKTLITQT